MQSKKLYKILQSKKLFIKIFLKSKILFKNINTKVLVFKNIERRKFWKIIIKWNILQASKFCANNFLRLEFVFKICSLKNYSAKEFLICYLQNRFTYTVKNSSHHFKYFCAFQTFSFTYECNIPLLKLVGEGGAPAIFPSSGLVLAISWDGV